MTLLEEEAGTAGRCELCGGAPAVVDIPAFSGDHGPIRMFVCRACADDLDCT